MLKLGWEVGRRIEVRGVGSRELSGGCLVFGGFFWVVVSRVGKDSRRIRVQRACSRIRGAGGGAGGIAVVAGGG